MSLTVNQHAFEDAAQEAAKRLLRAAVFFQQHHQQQLQTSFPPASKPGEYPHKRTGFGIANVVYGPTDVAGIIAAGFKVRVGEVRNAFYMVLLERKRGRLGFEKSAETLRPIIAAILGK